VKIMETSMPNDARTMPKACSDARGHDDVQPCIETVIEGLASRSDAERGALLKALLDGQYGANLAAYAAPSTGEDEMPLPGLEASIDEKARQNSTPMEDSNFSPRRGPLPGTSYSQSIENARGSSNGRSPESVRYDELLRENGSSSGQKSRKTATVEDRICYGKLLADRIVPVNVQRQRGCDVCRDYSS
jgi:hypothetical protein